jgi:glutamate-1-semialdehyde 2,1-aminomutase
METVFALTAGLGTVLVAAVPGMRARLRLLRAQHPSLQGHPWVSRWLAGHVPFYEYDAAGFFRADHAPAEVVERRRVGFERLACRLGGSAPRTIERSAALESNLSDLQFTTTYRVPFQYRSYVKQHLRVGAVVVSSSGVRLRDLDGNTAYDVSGSYGTNLFGYDFYKSCIDEGIERVRALGPVLGVYHPLVSENAARLSQISGLDEISFHMSGTEAVMQAVRLARYHTGRSHLVRFCGAYHGWWDGVQPGVGNSRPADDVYTLRDMDEATLDVLRTRRDIACVLVNPLQMLHPNADAPADATLISGRRGVPVDRSSYAEWLQRLRAVCTRRGIVLILDEVFTGFRLAPGGAQEYFGVAADMVTYGKTLGGGLPVGVLCGRRELMKRFRDDRPSDICFARGTFNTHPYVMGAMHAFLRRSDTPAVRASYDAADSEWNERAGDLNRRLESERLPVRVSNLVSIWSIGYTTPSRYHWMLQYYLRAEELALSWVGTGRLIFSHNYSAQDFEEVARRFLAAAVAMREDGWWWHEPSAAKGAIERRVLQELAAARFPRTASLARSCGLLLNDRVE